MAYGREKGVPTVFMAFRGLGASTRLRTSVGGGSAEIDVCVHNLYETCSKSVAADYWTKTYLHFLCFSLNNSFGQEEPDLGARAAAVFKLQSSGRKQQACGACLRQQSESDLVYPAIRGEIRSSSRHCLE